MFLRPDLEQSTIASGSPFIDLGFGVGTPHGRQIHRIQWNLLVREMDAQPKVFGGIPGVEYYKEFGALNTAGMNGYKPWNALFDSFASGPTSPEGFRDVEKMLPMIGRWE